MASTTREATGSGTQSPETPGKRRWRRSALWILLFGAVVALFVSTQEDLPRALVEGLLARTLNADVSLGGFHWLGWRRFELHNLVVRRIAHAPQVELVQVASLGVQGSPVGIWAGHFDLLSLTSGQVRLVPTNAGPSTVSIRGLPKLDVKHLLCERGLLVVAVGGKEARFRVEGAIENVGVDAEGSVRVRARRLPLDPFIALMARGRGSSSSSPAERLAQGAALEDFEASVSFERLGPEMGLRVQGRSLTLARGGGAPIPAGPRLEATLRREPAADMLRLEVEARLPFLEKGTLVAHLDSRTGAFRGGEGHLDGLDLGKMLSLVPVLPEGGSVDGQASVSAEATSAEQLQVTLRASLRQIALPLGEKALMARDVEIAVNCSPALQGGSWRGTFDLDANIPRASARIRGYSVPRHLFPIGVQAKGTVEGLAPVTGSGHLEIVTADAGRLSLQGGLTLPETGGSADLNWTWGDAKLAKLGELAREAGVGMVGVEMEGEVEARGTLRGKIASPRLEGVVEVKELMAAPAATHAAVAAARPWTVRHGKGIARFNWDGAEAPVRLPSVEADASLALLSLEPTTVRLAAAGWVQGALDGARLEEARVELPDLGSLRAQGQWDSRDATRATATLKAEAPDLGRWKRVARPFIGPALEDFDLKGSMKGDLKARLDASNRWSAAGTVRVDGSGFTSKDGSRVLEGLGVDGNVQAQGHVGGEIRADAGATFTGFELLWGSIYADGSSLGSKLVLSATSSRGSHGSATPAGSVPQGKSPSRSWKMAASWRLPQGPFVDATLNASPGEPLAYSMTLQVPDLGTAMARYLREPLGASVAVLKKTEAAGALSILTEGILSDALRTARGRLRMDKSRLEGTQGAFSVQGLDLDLPFDLVWTPPGEGHDWVLGGPAREGRIEFARLGIAGLALPATASVLGVQADTVALVEPLSVPLLGGRVTFEKLGLADVLRPSRHLVTAVLLSGLDLGQASEAFGLPMLQGEASGSFRNVQLTPDVLKVEGGGTVKLFDGIVTLGGISGSDVFSRYPKITFSADFTGIDLGLATQVFDFGKMTGSVEGYVHDCQLFGGVPVAFEAEVRTLDGKSGSVSVKAVENITILGGGGRLDLLDRWIRMFFDEYTYSRLGIHMKLERDVFVIRGLEHSGEKELFLKGRLPFPINIVNAEPARNVSFSSMLERLRTVDFHAAATR